MSRAGTVGALCASAKARTAAAIGALTFIATGASTYHRHGDVVVGEDRAVAGHRPQHVRAWLSEGGADRPQVVGWRFGDQVRRRPRRIRVGARVRPRLHLLGAERDGRRLPAVDDPRQTKAGA